MIFFLISSRSASAKAELDGGPRQGRRGKQGRPWPTPYTVSPEGRPAEMRQQTRHGDNQALPSGPRLFDAGTRNVVKGESSRGGAPDAALGHPPGSTTAEARRRPRRGRTRNAVTEDSRRRGSGASHHYRGHVGDGRSCWCTYRFEPFRIKVLALSSEAERAVDRDRCRRPGSWPALLRSCEGLQSAARPAASASVPSAPASRTGPGPGARIERWAFAGRRQVALAVAADDFHDPAVAHL